MLTFNSLLVLGLGILVPVHASGGVDKLISPDYSPWIFSQPMPIPPVAQALATYEGENGTIDFFEVHIKEFNKQIYPNLGPTTFTGYNAITPGPTFHMTRGRMAVVRFINDYFNPSSIHLHSSFTRAPWDGWAEDVTLPGQYKDYFYPNGQPQRTLWYHDHAIGITAVNAYFGQAGFYILKDPIEGDLGLPVGNYDIPISLVARFFNGDGTLMSPIDERVSFYGDIIMANGIPWPFLEVEPRKYKFRLLDTGVSRTYSLYFAEDSTPNTKQTMTVVGSDCGYLSSPAKTDTLVLAVAERWEVVFDFAPFIGKNVTLRNSRDFQTNPDYPDTDKVVKFIVGNTVSDTTNNGEVQNPLTALDLPGAHTQVDHHFTFERDNGQWLINGVGFEDVPNRILAKPQQGTLERWILTNKSGGWSHPIHIHLIDFQIVSRVGGRGAVTGYEAVSLKDVVYLGENEEVELVANFQPWGGVYMFHCHNLVHEDHDMMAAFNVTDVDLTEFGYPDNQTFTDPMAAVWRARNYTGPIGTFSSDLTQVKNVLLPMFAALNAYPSETELGVLPFEEALEEYYETHAEIPDPKPVVPVITKRTTTHESRGLIDSIINRDVIARENMMSRNPAMDLKFPRRGLGESKILE